MSGYSLLTAFEVLEFLLKQPRRTQIELRNRMLKICDYPGNHSDYLEPDDLGRQHHVNVFGAYAIKYWVDDADVRSRL